MAAFVLQGIIYNAINMMEIADKTLVSVVGKILLVAILGLLVSCNNSQDPYAVKKSWEYDAENGGQGDVYGKSSAGFSILLLLREFLNERLWRDPVL